MCEFKLEIMSVGVWGEKKKKAAGGAIGYNALVAGFIFLFSSGGVTSSSRLCALCGLHLWILCDADALTHGRNTQRSIKAQY